MRSWLADLKLVILLASTYARPDEIAKIDGDDVHAAIMRSKRDVTNSLQLSELQTQLPVSVDLGGFVDYLTSVFERNLATVVERNLTNFRNEIEKKVREEIASLKENSGNTGGNTSGETGENKNAKLTSTPPSKHSNHVNIPDGQPSNLQPPSEGEPAEPLTGFSWKSILGGCVQNPAELDGWTLLQNRNVKEAGEFFTMLTEKQLKEGYNHPVYAEKASWLGLKKMRDLVFFDKDGYWRNDIANSSFDLILSYHCEGQVRCTRYNNFSVQDIPYDEHLNYFVPKDLYYLFLGSEVHHEGMLPHLLDKYNGNYYGFGCALDYYIYKLGSVDKRVFDKRLNYTVGQSKAKWFFQRNRNGPIPQHNQPLRLFFAENTNTITLCPTCHEVGASFEEIGFDASKCTDTFMAARRMH